MNEAEWLTGDDAGAMLYFVRDRAGERKARLIAAACCRRLAPLLCDPRSLAAVAVAERYADGLAVSSELAAAFRAARAAADEIESARRDPEGIVQMDAASAAACAAVCVSCDRLAPERRGAVECDPAGSTVFYACVAAYDLALKRTGDHVEAARAEAAEQAWLARLLRDLFSNPYRSRTMVVAAWRTPDVVTLAGHVYHDRAFDCLPELAEALEAAGCGDAELLGHLRGPGPHARGCRAVDLVLGKE
jgi:hypothetical protein